MPRRKEKMYSVQTAIRIGFSQRTLLSVGSYVFSGARCIGANFVKSVLPSLLFDRRALGFSSSSDFGGLLSQVCLASMHRARLPSSCSDPAMRPRGGLGVVDTAPSG